MGSAYNNNVTVFEKTGQLTESNPVRAIIVSIAQTWRFHDTVHVDYSTYVESMRVVRKPTATRCLRENTTVLVRAPCTVMLCGGVCGVGREYYASTLTSTYITYARKNT